MSEIVNQEESFVIFKQLVENFCADLLTTFPEQTHSINRCLSQLRSEQPESKKILYNECSRNFINHASSISNRDGTIFETVDFLPGICFNKLWSTDNITDNTRLAIWSHLDIIHKSCKTTVFEYGMCNNDDRILDEAAEEFVKVDPPIIEDTWDNNTENEPEPATDSEPSANMDELLNSMMNGKIGKLATEMSENSLKDLNIDENADPKDIMAQLFSNPQSFMDIFANAKNVLTEKIETGEISTNELMAEMSGFIKGISPGSDDITESTSPNDLLKSFAGIGEAMAGAGNGNGGSGGGQPDFANIMKTVMGAVGSSMGGTGTDEDIDGLDINPLQQMMKSFTQPPKPKNEKYINMKNKLKAKHMANEEAKMRAILAQLQPQTQIINTVENEESCRDDLILQPGQNPCQQIPAIDLQPNSETSDTISEVKPKPKSKSKHNNKNKHKKGKK